MDRLGKLINTLKLTPHYQPDLVKEASHLILSRSLKADLQAKKKTGQVLGPLIEILIQYCDNNDSSQRSLFNDYLNSVILNFQHDDYLIIFNVLLDKIKDNGSARTVTAALHRIPHLIQNVQPVELGCEPQKLLKALIEVSRRSNDESILKALDAALKHLMPILDHSINKSKDMQMLSNSLVDILLRNLQHESSHTKRLAASSLAHLSSNCEILCNNITCKVTKQLQVGDFSSETFIGFCYCIKAIPTLSQHNHLAIIESILNQIAKDINDTTVVSSALELLKDLFKLPVDESTIERCAKTLIAGFLVDERDGQKVVKEDVKVILQANALACLASMVKQRPNIVEQHELVFSFKNHHDTAVRNQFIILVGNYIKASWRYPNCVDSSVDCERSRKLWVELRSILTDESVHSDNLKTCITALKTCLKTLLESDHCLHIVEYSDFDHLIQLYTSSNFKPLKIEALSLFAELDYRAIYYLEECHWSKLRIKTAGSKIDSIQDKILNSVIIKSLADEHPRVRMAASSALVTVVANLYHPCLESSNNRDDPPQRSTEPIVSLAQDLAYEHLAVLKNAEEFVYHFNSDGEPIICPDLHERSCLNNDHRPMSSSIVCEPGNSLDRSSDKSQNRINISINLKHVFARLRMELQESLSKGKTVISSIVHALYELSISYPIYEYTKSWDCRPSEYCDTFTLLNFLLTYMENLTEPDIVVGELEVYKNFLLLTHQLLYAICHECLLNSYETQKMRPLHKRQANCREGDWSEATLKPPRVASCLEVCFTHHTKLLWLLSYIIEEQTNPFVSSSRQPQPSNSLDTVNQKLQSIDLNLNHRILTSNQLLFGRAYKKLESSYRSGKKNLNQYSEKFHQILETCLHNLSSLLEFVNMSKATEHVKEILGYLKITSGLCGASSLRCSRQLLKCLFGINLIALYQADPVDWFEDNTWQACPNPTSGHVKSCHSVQAVYHHLVTNPYRIFSNYYSMLNCTPTFDDKTLTMLNFKTRRSLNVRRRIEDRVRSLFEINYLELTPRVRQLSDSLKSLITEFTPLVKLCMSRFDSKGFCSYQCEVVHFMSYLVLLRVNFYKLEHSDKLIQSINRLLDNCGERMYSSLGTKMSEFLRQSFTFLTLLTYERGPSKPMFQVAAVIQKLDDLRAKLSLAGLKNDDITLYIVPPLRCLVEDLFIYRTSQFHSNPESSSQKINNLNSSGKDAYSLLEAERETVAQKLLDVVCDPKIYDLLSILILESRSDFSEIKYKRFSQLLLSIIPGLLSKQAVKFTDYKCIEFTIKIIENIAPEVFHPINFMFETLFENPNPSNENKEDTTEKFRRWMSLVIITIHILTTQTKEEVFLARLRENMSDESFVEYLLLIAQLCLAEIHLNLLSPEVDRDESGVTLLTQQLSSYILYLTHMFQSGLLSKTASNRLKGQYSIPKLEFQSFSEICNWARDPDHGFCKDACEQMFFHVRMIYPDLTIFWCNLMMLLNDVDCNHDFWSNLLIYECHHCRSTEAPEIPVADCSITDASIVALDNGQKDDSRFKRSSHVSRPCSLRLSDVSLEHQLRRSFIKRITEETKDKTYHNRNIVEFSDDEGKLLERVVNIGNTEQCLSPNIELARRGSLCLVLDFVTINMHDVEHITWLIIHHINDIIRWSHEMPISEFITAVHSNSASSGIFIQAINTSFTNLSSMASVTRLIWSLREVHYTQYGSLVVLLIEKLLSSPELLPYLSLTQKIEEFACSTVQKLINKTNKSLVTTNEEVINQLTVEELDRISPMFDSGLYPKLSKMLVDLRKSIQDQPDNPSIEFHHDHRDSDEDSDCDTLHIVYSKANLIYWLSEQNYTAHISNLIPALNSIRGFLSNEECVEQINEDKSTVCSLVSAIYSLATNFIKPPRQFIRPKAWVQPTRPDELKCDSPKSQSKPVKRPALPDLKSPLTKAPNLNLEPILARNTHYSTEHMIEALRTACLKVLFMYENIHDLQATQFEHLVEVIIRLARLPLINPFVLVPPQLWKQGLWPESFQAGDDLKIAFPMVTHDILLKDFSLVDNFCERSLTLGWISRRQFEEVWMTLLGVLSTTSVPTERPRQDGDNSFNREDRKANLLASRNTIVFITKYLLLSNRSIPGDPLSGELSTSQTFESRINDLAKVIATNLKPLSTIKVGSNEANVNIVDQLSFNQHLRVPAQKLRFNAIEMQDTVVIDSDSSRKKPDIESCIKLLCSIYKQVQPSQLATPIATAISQSILALSDLFTEIDQFEWLFDTFIDMFKLAERCEDEIQLQYLIIGLCKSVAICCYELSSEQITSTIINHRDVMFEKCRQSIEKCMKSSFRPLRVHTLSGVFYILEDSINIVASGAYELDHFKEFRLNRLSWILKLSPALRLGESFTIQDPELNKLVKRFSELVTGVTSNIVADG